MQIYFSWGQGVVGSNPAVPTNKSMGYGISFLLRHQNTGFVIPLVIPFFIAWAYCRQ